jgi:hypothetical protein
MNVRGRAICHDECGIVGMSEQYVAASARNTINIKLARLRNKKKLKRST